MPAVQIRITLLFAAAIELMRDYIDRCTKVLVFQHEADEDVNRDHCHIYLFDLPLKRPDDAIRDHLRIHLPKTDFMVGLSAGKQKRQIEPEGAYIYATKEKGIDPLLVKGFSDKDLMDCQIAAKTFYKAGRMAKDGKVVVLHVTEVKPDNVWNYFYEKMLRGDPVMKTWDIARFKKWIMVDYLNRCRPVPRTGDLQRYAFSLYMLRDHIGSNPNEDSPLTIDDIPRDA